jgi:hypothetical protein
MSKTLKYAIIAIIALILVTIACIVHRMFFQFDSKEIKEYVREEAEKYGDKQAAYALIMDGVEYILGSHNLTQQVLKSARASKTDKEQELVHAAIQQCKAFKYLS